MKVTTLELRWIFAALGPGLYMPAGHVLETIGLGMMLLSVLLALEAKR